MQLYIYIYNLPNANFKIRIYLPYDIYYYVISISQDCHGMLAMVSKE